VTRKTVSMSGLKFMCAALLALAILAIAHAPASAINIQKVKSPGGIEAWLVEDHSIPLISARFAFRGGAANDPAGKEGVSNFLSGMLDEGAGDLDSQAFQQQLNDHSIQMSFETGRDWFSGRLRTLTENRDKAFGLLALALTKPRFDPKPLQRIRDQLIIEMRRNEQSPNYLASRAWMRAAFGNHVYGRPVNGTAKTLAAITADDLKAAADTLFRKKEMKIAVVGDIDAKTLAGLLDDTFGGLKMPLALTSVPDVEVAGGGVVKLIEMKIPQTVIQFGSKGLKRNDKDFIPAYIVNYILGGGGFSSRLYEEIREKRGLVYSVYSYLVPYKQAGLLMGGAATGNKTVGEALTVIREQIKRLADEGPTAKELDAAKTYLTGSFALRFDTGNKIAGQLIGLQTGDLGADYIDKRNGLINAVTLEDVKRVARRLLDADDLIVTLVGKPENVKLQKTGG